MNTENFSSLKLFLFTKTFCHLGLFTFCCRKTFTRISHKIILKDDKMRTIFSLTLVVILVNLDLILADEKSENKLKIGIKKRVRHYRFYLDIQLIVILTWRFRLKLVSRKVGKEICSTSTTQELYSMELFLTLLKVEIH